MDRTCFRNPFFNGEGFRFARQKPFQFFKLCLRHPVPNIFTVCMDGKYIFDLPTVIQRAVKMLPLSGCVCQHGRPSIHQAVKFIDSFPGSRMVFMSLSFQVCHRFCRQGLPVLLLLRFICLLLQFFIIHHLAVCHRYPLVPKNIFHRFCQRYIRIVIHTTVQLTELIAITV